MYEDDGDDMLGWTVWSTYKQCHVHWPSLWCLCRGCSAMFFMHAKLFSCVQFFATLWTVACQAPSSMGFSRQDWEWELPWSGMSCPPPGNPSDPGMESTSLTSPALADRFFTISTTWEAQTMFYYKATQGWISCPSYELLRCGQEIQRDTNLWVLHQTFQSQG